MTEEMLTRLHAFLEEDLGGGDITSESTIAAGRRATGEVHAREPAVVAGLEEATALAGAVDLDASTHAIEGDEIEAGQLVLRLSGSARRILGVERTLLNLLSHMSGVATLTRRAVRSVAAAHTGARAPGPPRIAATRKTLPGLRALQKKAVVLGGGVPHRLNLSDAVLIKDNHLSMSPDIAATLARTRARVGSMAIEIEVECLEDALVAARAGADALLLDNLDPALVAAIVDALDAAGLRESLSLEASGGITLDTVAQYADTGVDVVSMGMLTTSARHVDFSLHFAA